jgi:hypothetical protein
MDIVTMEILGFPRIDLGCRVRIWNSDIIDFT